MVSKSKEGTEGWRSELDLGQGTASRMFFGDVRVGGTRCQLSEDSRVTCFGNIFGYFWYFKEACSGGILCPICQCCCLSPSTFFDFPNLLFHRDSKTFKWRDMTGWSMVPAYSPRMKPSLLAFLQLKHLQASAPQLRFPKFLKKPGFSMANFLGCIGKDGKTQS